MHAQRIRLCSLLRICKGLTRVFLLQIDVLRSQVSQLEVSAAAAEAEYSRQLARNMEELAQLRATRGKELTAMLVSHFGNRQHRHLSSCWGDCCVALQGIWVKQSAARSVSAC